MEQQVNTQSSERLFDIIKVDAMLRDVKSIGDLTKPGGVIQQMIKSTVERILKAKPSRSITSVILPTRRPQNGVPIVATVIS